MATTPTPGTTSEREACLARAGWNVLNLDGEEVPIDLFTDVPARAFHPAVRAAGDEARAPDLQALATAIYGGGFRYLASTKGRAAERLLVGALGKSAPTVVTHGLFMTTQLALAQAGAKIELAPRRAGDEQSCDPDPAWIERRLAAGGVDLVYLEVCHNGFGGLPLTRAALEATARACRRHGALLLLDAARLLTNSLAVTDGDGATLLETTRDFAALADAFTVSCSKELLVPFGSLVAVRDAALERRAYAIGFETGALLEPLEARLRLAVGMAHMAAHAPSVLRERRRKLERLAAGLRERGLAPLDPTGHALFLPVAPELLAGAPTRARSLEALLFLRGGVRALLFPYPLLGRSLFRLSLPLERYGDDEMDRAAEALHFTITHADEAPALTAIPDAGLHPSLAHYGRA